MGAWIETHYLINVNDCSMVAPYVGAWIETGSTCHLLPSFWSHPTWVRGLKHPNLVFNPYLDESHPTWVRGLKLEEP